MNPNQTQKIQQALSSGQRRTGRGKRIPLNDHIRQQYELRLKSEKAKNGEFVYVSVLPGPVVTNYGPARRFGRKLVTQEQFKELLQTN